MEHSHVARLFNRRVLLLAASFELLGADGPLGFLCECGCWSHVELTADEYVRERGAWVRGHGAAPTARDGTPAA